MKTCPMRIWEADQFVKLFHRHNKMSGNGKFAFGVMHNSELVGVAICGRPRSRHLDDGKTLEVYRVCTCGFPNAVSFLYSRSKRIGQLLGYSTFITYTLMAESGSSLRAINGRVTKEVMHKKQWNNHGNAKRSIQPVTIMPKLRWSL